MEVDKKMTTELTQPLEIYDPFRTQLKEIIKKEESTVFNYESKEGEKAARSYVYSIRQSKTAVDECRKKAKAESLAYCKKIDKEAKEIIMSLDAIIGKHMVAITEIEHREKYRIDLIIKRIENLNNAYLVKNNDGSDLNSRELAALLFKIENVNIDDSFEEFVGKAFQAKEIAVFQITQSLNNAEKKETEKAELEALRKEKNERDIRDKEQAIKLEAEEEERKANKLSDQVEKENAHKREVNLKLAAERRELEIEEDKATLIAKHKAELDAEREKTARKEKEKKEKLAREIKAKEDAEAKEKADKKKKANELEYRHRVEKQAIESIITYKIITHEHAVWIVHKIKNRGFDNITLNY